MKNNDSFFNLHKYFQKLIGFFLTSPLFYLIMKSLWKSFSE